jgi:signal transduction histidine kinase
MMFIIMLATCTQRYWNRRFSVYAHYIWAIGVIVVLPFGFGHMLIQEAVRIDVGQTVHDMLVLQYVAALFLLIQLCNSTKLTILFWLSGSGFALLPLAWMDIPNFEELYRVTSLNLGAYLTMILVGVIANQNVRSVEEARLETARNIATNIAHELRTPLASIRQFANGAQLHFKHLVETYERSRSLGLATGNLKPAHVGTLSMVFDSIEKETAYSNMIIDMLLVRSGQRPTTQLDWEKFNVSEVVTEALQRFPANNEFEKNLPKLFLHRDFQISGPRLLVVHTIVNLLKNAVYYSQKAKYPRVELHVSVEPRRWGVIRVLDNGPGISGESVRHLFSPFYTTTKAGEGTGIGLSFCKRVMDDLGGSIRFVDSAELPTCFEARFPI